MPPKCLRVFTAVLALSATAVFCQQAPPIVQPGAPGQSGKTLTPATASATTQREPSAADIKFMQDMVMHHGQAVEMTELLRTRSHDPAIQAIGKRISVSQTDEMRYMKQWLTDRGKPLVDQDSMAGMDMSSMDMQDMPMMVGMLSPRQMAALAKASGPEFDHLFLTGMIQHHTGAVSMVKKLFDTPGAGQDPMLFDFANDVDNTQLAEIDIMKHMLKEKP